MVKTYVKDVRTERKFIIGLDLGQVNDYTAFAILERLQDVTTVRKPVYYSRDKVIIDDWVDEEQVGEAMYQCRHIERLKLGTPYPAVIDRLGQLIATPEIDGAYMLVVDQTGVGRPVFDLVTKAGFEAVGVTITGGDAITWRGREVRVAKRLLVSTLQAVIQTKRLTFASGMQNVDILLDEFKAFDYKLSDSANDLYGAREGEHDDLVIAVALGLWMGEKYGNPQKKAVNLRYN